jgi:excisionase family DNA binding protein
VDDVLLTEREVAARFRCGERVVRKMIKSGQLPAVRLGDRLVRIPVAAVDQLLAVPPMGSTDGQE